MLFNKLRLRSGEVIENRFMKSAISEGLSDNGNPNSDLINLYKVWSENEIGLMVSGNVMVDRNAIGEPANIILDNKSDKESFKKWANVAKRNKAAFWLQLNHPGKQAPRFLNKYGLAPSAISYEGPISKLFAKPREMKEEDIQDVILKFVNAAKLAKEYGFTGVQIHAAHGYLISQFLSNRYNKREDKWGGTLENRARFLLEVYKEIRREVGSDFSIGIKINSADFLDDGLTEEESIQVIMWLDQLGIDMVEISGGNFEKSVFVQDVQHEEGFFKTFAQKAKSLIDAPIALTGGMRSAKFMEEQLVNGTTDIIGLARPFVSEPILIKKIKADGDFKINTKKGKSNSKSSDSFNLNSLSWYIKQMHHISKTSKC